MSSKTSFACLVGGLVSMVACGGSVTGVDGGTDAGSDSPTSSGCPTSPPTPGASCSQNIECEYGSNPDPNCNSLFQCTGGSWKDLTTGGVCAPQSQCPATYASVPVGQDCSPDKLSCSYPQGECICTTSFGGLQKQTPAWNCFPPASGCPSPRPEIGSACSGDPATCDYGACSGGVALACQNGAWQQEQVPCPL